MSRRQLDRTQKLEEQSDVRQTVKSLVPCRMKSPQGDIYSENNQGQNTPRKYQPLKVSGKNTVGKDITKKKKNSERKTR